MFGNASDLDYVNCLCHSGHAMRRLLVSVLYLFWSFSLNIQFLSLDDTKAFVVMVLFVLKVYKASPGSGCVVSHIGNIQYYNLRICTRGCGYVCCESLW